MVIFDDDVASRTALRRALQSAGGMFITEASNCRGREGGGLSFPGSVDVIVSAMRLDLGSGLLLLKAIRTGRIRGVKPDVCFIFVTDINDPALVAAAVQLDANGYVIKPYTTTRLRDAILRGRTKAITADTAKYAAANPWCG
jgi:DNA-binding NarL/FixJ family response regulator